MYLPNPAEVKQLLSISSRKFTQELHKNMVRIFKTVCRNINRNTCVNRFYIGNTPVNNLNDYKHLLQLMCRHTYQINFEIHSLLRYSERNHNKNPNLSANMLAIRYCHENH